VDAVRSLDRAVAEPFRNHKKTPKTNVTFCSPAFPCLRPEPVLAGLHIMYTLLYIYLLHNIYIIAYIYSQNSVLESSSRQKVVSAPVNGSE
jgi:hypothetical protein